MTTTTPPAVGPMNPRDPRPPRYRADGTLLCSGHRSNGKDCNAPAVRGTTVCRVHGGSAPQVQRKARMRLAEMVDPALATLAREMVNPNGSAQSRLRAAENVLDRAGFPRHLETSSEEARVLLTERLIQFREQQLQDRRKPRKRKTTPPPVVIEGSVEPDQEDRDEA